MPDLNDVVRHVILKIVVDQAGLGAELAAARAKLKGLQDLEDQHSGQRDKSEQDHANKQAKHDQDLKQRLLDAQAKRRDAHKERMAQLEEENRKLKANADLAEERARNERLGGQTTRANRRNESQARTDATNARRDATTRESEAKAEQTAARTAAVERESLAKTKATNQKRLDSHKSTLAKIEQAETAHAQKLANIQSRFDQDLTQRRLDQQAKRRDANKEYRARDTRRQATLQPTIDTDLIKLDKARDTARSQADAASSRADRAKNAVLQDQEKHRTRIAILANEEVIAEQRALQIAEQRARAFRQDEESTRRGRRSATTLTGAFFDTTRNLRSELRELDGVREMRKEMRSLGSTTNDSKAIFSGFFSALGRDAKRGVRTMREVRAHARGVGDDIKSLSGGGGGNGFFRNLFVGLGDLGKNLQGQLGGVFKSLLSFRGLIVAVLTTLGPLAAILGAVGAAALGLASDLGALVGALGALPGLISAAVSGFGALAITLQPLGNVFTAFTAKQKAATDALAGGGAAARDAARALVDARRELQDAETENERAQEDLPRSQSKLNDAYKDAARRIQDYRLALQKLKFDQEGSDLGVESAEQAYRRALADPTANNLDRKIARHNVEGALFDRRDQKVASGRLIEDAAEAEKKGVAGADEVIDAQRGVEDAFRRVTDAATRLTRAQEDLIQAQKDTAAGGAAVRKAADELKAALGKLHPDARKVVQAILDLDGAYKAMQKRLQGRLFEPLSKDTGLFKDALKSLESFLGPSADAIGKFADNALKLFTNPEWKLFWSSQGEENGKVLGSLGVAALDFAAGLKDIIVLARPLTQYVVSAIGGMAKSFKEFTSSREGREQIKTFFETTVRTLKELGPVVSTVLRGLGGFFKALNQPGADGGDSFTTKINKGLLEMAHNFLDLANKAQDPKGGFQKWLKSVGPLLKDVVAFLGDAGRFFGNLMSNPDNLKEASKLLEQIGQRWLPAIARIFDKLSESGFLSNLAGALSNIFEDLAYFMDHGGVGMVSAFGLALSAVANVIDYLVEHVPGLTRLLAGMGAFFSGVLVVGLLAAISKVTGLTSVMRVLFSIAKPLFLALGSGRGFLDNFKDRALGRDKNQTAAQRAAAQSAATVARGGTPPDMTNRGGMLPTVYRIEVHTKVMAELLKQIAIDVNTIRANRGGTGSNPNAPGRKFGGGRTRNPNRNQGASNVFPPGGQPSGGQGGDVSVGLQHAKRTSSEIKGLDTNLGKLANQFKATGGAKDVFIRELRGLSREFGKLGGAGNDASRLATNLQKLIGPLESLKALSGHLRGLKDVAGDTRKLSQNFEQLSAQFRVTGGAKDQFIANLKLLASQFERTHAASDRYNTQLKRQAKRYDDPDAGTYIPQGRATVSQGSQADPDDPASQPTQKKSGSASAGRNPKRGGRKSRKAIADAFRNMFSQGDDTGSVPIEMATFGASNLFPDPDDPDRGRQKKVSKAEKEAHKINNRKDEDERVTSGGGGTFGRFQQFLGDRRLRNQRAEDRPPYDTANAENEQRRSERRRGFLGSKYAAVQAAANSDFPEVRSHLAQGRGDEGSIDFGVNQLNGRFLGIPLPGAENARKRQTTRDLNAARQASQGRSQDERTDHRWGQAFTAIDRREARQNQSALRNAARDGFISPIYDTSDDGSRTAMMAPASTYDSTGRRRFLQQPMIPGAGNGGPRFWPQAEPETPRRAASTGYAQPVIPGLGTPLVRQESTQDQREKYKGQRRAAEIRRTARQDPTGMFYPEEPTANYAMTNAERARRVTDARSRPRPDAPSGRRQFTTEQHPHLSYEHNDEGYGSESMNAYGQDKHGERYPAGELTWDRNSREIKWVNTQPEQARTGINSNSLRFARTTGVVKHSDNLLSPGVNFARATGGDFMEQSTIDRIGADPHNSQADDDGYDRDGKDENGYDKYGYDRDGKDENGYDRAGYDRDGKADDGYSDRGFDRDGKDAHGYSRAGYDRFGKDPQGYSRGGKDDWGYDRDGYDKEGYNDEDKNRRGLSRERVEQKSDAAERAEKLTRQIPGQGALIDPTGRVKPSSRTLPGQRPAKPVGPVQGPEKPPRRKAGRGDAGFMQVGPTNGRFLGIPMPGQGNAAARSRSRTDRQERRTRRGQRSGGGAGANLLQSLLFDATDFTSTNPADLGFAATNLFADVAGGAQDIRAERQYDDEETPRRRRTGRATARRPSRGHSRRRSLTRRPGVGSRPNLRSAVAGDAAEYEEGYEDGYDDAQGGGGQQGLDLPDRDDDRHPNRRQGEGDEDRPKSRSERRAERRAARSGGAGGREAGGGRGGRLGNFLRGGGRGARLGGGAARAVEGVAGRGLLRGAAGGLLRGAAGGLGGIAASLALSLGGEAAINKFVKDDDDASSLSRGLGAVSTGAGIGATIGSVIPGVGTVIGGAVGGLAGGAYSLYKDKNLRSFVGGKLAGAGKAVGGALSSAGKAVGGFFSDTFGGEKEDGTKKSFGERVGSILGGVTPIGALLKNTDIGKSVLDSLKKAGGAIGDFFTKTIPERFHKGVKSITDFFTKTLPSLPGKAFDAFFVGVGVVIGFFKHDLPRAAAAAWRGVTTFFTKTLPHAAGVAWGAITGFFTKTLPRAAEVAWEGIKTFFTSTLPQKAGEAWTFVKDRLWKPFKNFVTEDIPRFFTETIPNWFKAAPEKIREHIITPLTDFFTKKLPEFFTVTLPNAISKLPGKIKSAIVDPVVNFFTGIGDHIGKGWSAFKDWAGGLFSRAGDDINTGETSRKQSGGLIEGVYQGVEDRVRVLATPGEFMVRRSKVEQPGAKAFLNDFNEGRVDPSQFYAALNQPPVMSMAPQVVPMPAAGMSTVNNTTTNGGLKIGDITINNPKPEKAGQSLRRQIQIQHMRHRL